MNHIDKIKLNPSLHYRDPSDVARDPLLNDRERLDILTAWELDARALSLAADEGLAGGEPSRLQAVVNARLEVEARVKAAA